MGLWKHRELYHQSFVRGMRGIKWDLLVDFGDSWPTVEACRAPSRPSWRPWTREAGRLARVVKLEKVILRAMDRWKHCKLCRQSLICLVKMVEGVCCRLAIMSIWPDVGRRREA